MEVNRNVCDLVMSNYENETCWSGSESNWGALTALPLYVAIGMTSVCLNLITVITVPQLSSTLHPNVCLSLALLSICFIVMDVNFMRIGVNNVRFLLSPDLQPFAHSFCATDILPSILGVHWSNYIPVLLALERYLDCRYQIQHDQISRWFALLVFGTLGLNITVQSILTRGSAAICRCTCTLSTVPLSTFLFLIVGLMGSTYLLQLFLFTWIKRTNERLLAKFNLTAHTHSLSERYRQKNRLKIANLLRVLVTVTVCGNASRTIVSGMFRVFKPAYLDNDVGDVIFSITVHSITAISHCLHVIVLHKKCPNFGKCVRNMLVTCRGKLHGNQVTQISPGNNETTAVENHQMSAVKSFILLEKIWENNGFSTV